MSDERSARRELVVEITNFLKKKNAYDSLSFLDRPFFVALLAGLILAVLSHTWDDQQKIRTSEATDKNTRLSLKQQQLQNLGLSYWSFAALNSLFAREIWIQKEILKGRDGNQNLITQWRSEAVQIESRLIGIPALDTSLISIGIVYECEKVRSKAQAEREMLRKFTELQQNSVIKWHSEEQKDKTDQAAVHVTDNLRYETKKTISKLEDELVKAMAEELIGSDTQDKQCD